MKTEKRGFTLIELAVVTAVIGVLSLILMPSLMDMVESKRLDAERLSLANLEEDIKRSFQDVDWARNLASFPGLMPTDVTAQYATVFGTCGVNSVAVDSAWYVKLGRIRGIVPEIGTPISPDLQKSLFDLAYNSYNQPRMLVAGPTEPNQQRYLLVSLMSPDVKGLVVPANDGSVGWFDAVWNNNWENESATLPPDWVARLSAPQRDAWQPQLNKKTNCYRLVIRRIVQPKYSITVNNSHQAYTGWVDINGITDNIGCGPGAAPRVTTDILAGSLVVFRRGASAPGNEVFRLHLNDNTTFTVQAGGP